MFNSKSCGEKIVKVKLDKNVINTGAVLVLLTPTKPRCWPSELRSSPKKTKLFLSTKHPFTYVWKELKLYLIYVVVSL